MRISHMHRHIRQLPPTQIFTTRHMLIYGTRAAIDSALCRMVKSGYIHRLAWGVFVKDKSAKPTIDEIVAAKAKAFGVKVVAHARRLLHKYKFQKDRDAFTFAKAGSSSGFNTIHGWATLKNNCARKMVLQESKAGQAVVALWQLFDDGWNTNRDAVSVLTESFDRVDRELLLFAGSLMPYWLNDACRFRHPSVPRNTENPFMEVMEVSNDLE